MTRDTWDEALAEMRRFMSAYPSEEYNQLLQEMLAGQAERDRKKP
jgi:hypothetical protein